MEFGVKVKLNGHAKMTDMGLCDANMVHSILKAAELGHMDHLESMTIEPFAELKMGALPKRIQRWCCQGKNCGNLELELVTHHFDYSDVDMHTYVRANNGKPYVDMNWMTTEAMHRWLWKTKDNVNPEPEEGK